MLKKLRHWRDIITIWAIYYFHLPLPSLIQEPQPVPGRVYYYYGRWFRLVRRNKDEQVSLRKEELQLLDIPDNLFLQTGRVDRLKLKMEVGSMLADTLCSRCVLSRLGLPCKKVYRSPSFQSDLCLTHKYQLILTKHHE